MTDLDDFQRRNGVAPPDGGVMRTRLVADAEPAPPRSGPDPRVAQLGLEQLEADRPKAPQRSMFARVSTAHFLMALFGLLGFGLTLLLLQSNEATVAVPVATRDLAVGESLDPTAYEMRQVPKSGPLASTAFVPTDDTDSLSVSAPVVKGAPILASIVDEGSPLDALSSFSVPIDDRRAFGGEFQTGDRVNLIAVVQAKVDGTETFVSTYIAGDVPVLGDRQESSGAFGGLTNYFVAVGLTTDQALAASSAMQAGELEVVRAGDDPIDMNSTVMSTSAGMIVVDRSTVNEILTQAQVEQ